MQNEDNVYNLPDRSKVVSLMELRNDRYLRRRATLTRRESMNDKINRIESRQLDLVKKQLMRNGNHSHKKLVGRLTKGFSEGRYGGLTEFHGLDST